MAFGTRYDKPHTVFYLEVSILVFLEWPLGRQKPQGGVNGIICFNPCFSGMAFGTTFAPLFYSGESGFQSLFFWNGLWDLCHLP